MKKMLSVFLAAALFLATSALWALGNHIVWSAQKILLAAIALALIGLAIYS